MTKRIVFALAGLLLSANAGRAQIDPNSAKALEFAERDFQRATLERGIDGWNSFFADNGAQYLNTSGVVRGHAAIRGLMGEFLNDTTTRLIWWPVSTEVGKKKGVAHTFGASGVVSTDSTGRLQIAGRGTYLTAWGQNRDGAWKVTADMGGQASPQAIMRAADSVAAKKLAAIESERSLAIARHDRAALERIYAPDFLGTSAPKKTVDLTQVLPILLQNDPSLLFTTRELQSSVAANTGIVTGILEASRKGVIAGKTSFVHVYTLRDGRWVFIRGVSAAMK